MLDGVETMLLDGYARQNSAKSFNQVTGRRYVDYIPNNPDLLHGYSL